MMNDTTEMGLTGGSNLNIMVADPAAASRRMLIAWLADAGHTVTEVTDREGLGRALSGPAYDAIFVDLDMVDVDQIDSFRQEHSGSTVRIVALTSHRVDWEDGRALAGRFDMYMPKPGGLDPVQRLLHGLATSPAVAAAHLAAADLSAIACRRAPELEVAGA